VNIISKQPPPTAKPISQFAHVSQFMENRVTQYGDSESDSTDLQMLDPHASDSSYEHHMLEQMRQHQEALATGQKKRIAFSRANRVRPTRSQSPPIIPFTGPIDEVVHVDLLDNVSTGSGSGSSVRSDERRRNKPWGWKAHKRNRDWYERAKKGLPPLETPAIKDADPLDHDDSIKMLDDSPLSHKSSTKSTPTTAQPQRIKSPQSGGLVDSLGDLSAASVLASTPAFPKKKFMSIREAIEAERRAEGIPLALPTPPPDSPTQENRRPLQKTSVDTATERRPIELTLKRDISPLQKAKEAINAKPVPQAQREDTRNLLRLLSRSASNSPSPVPAEKKQPTQATESQSSSQSPPLSATPEPLKRPSIAKARFHAESSTNAKIPEATPANAKTPKPIGAWIDTPVPSKFMQSTAVTQSKKDSKAPKKDLRESDDLNGGVNAAASSASSRPKSALAAILGFAKDRNEQPGNELGDATMHSLEDILEASGDDDIQESIEPNSRLTLPNIVTGEEDQEALREILEHRIASELPFSNGQPASSEERDLIRKIVDQRIARQQTTRPNSGQRKAEEPRTATLTPRRKERIEEQLQLQRMADRVQTLSSYSASMRAGLKRLERNITSAASCDHCDCPGNCFGAHPFSAIGRALLRTFIRPVDGKLRPTWFGILATIFLLWMIIEVSLCWAVCRPIYAYWTPQPFGPFEYPEPPYLTLGWAIRPIQTLLSGPLSILASFGKWFRGFILDMLVGDEVISAMQTKRTASRIVSTVTARLAEASDWSMEVDDFL
jgi:hypothetical protein